MNNDSKMSPLGISFLSTFLYRSFYIIGLFNLIISISKNDSIFSIILGSIFGLILVKCYFYINDKMPSKNIFEKINASFPKVIAKVFIFILILLFILISSYILYNLSLFVNYNLLNDINILPISILLVLSCVYLSSKGINTITRASGIFIFILIFLVIISLVALINYSNPVNLYPLLTNKFFNIYEGSIYYSILSVTSLFLLLIIPKDKIECNKKYSKYMITAYIVNSVYILISFILVISILGIKLTSILNYPDIIVLQKVSLLNFIERIEDIISFKFMFDGFLTIAVTIFYIKEGIISLFKIKTHNNIVIIPGLIILIISIYLSSLSLKMIIWLLLPILVIHFFLMLFIRKKT